MLKKVMAFVVSAVLAAAVLTACGGGSSASGSSASGSGSSSTAATGSSASSTGSSATGSAATGTSATGSSATGTSDPKAAFIGAWIMTSLVNENDEDSLSSDDLAALATIGLSFELTLSNDGKAVLNFFGEEMEGTWTVKSATVITMEFDGQPLDATLANGKLTIGDIDGVMTFEKK